MSETRDQNSGEVREPHPGGEFVFYKTRSGRTLRASRSRLNPDPGLRPGKRSPLESVRQAVTYAEFASKQTIYQCQAVATSLSAYNLAVVDYLGKPRVLDIDIRDWVCGVGQEIGIRAMDNFMVLSVRLVIRNAEFVWESGEAAQSETDSLLWTYTTQTSVVREPGVWLDAYAYDLPGNAGEYHLELR